VRLGAVVDEQESTAKGDWWQVAAACFPSHPCASQVELNTDFESLEYTCFIATSVERNKPSIGYS